MASPTLDTIGWYGRCVEDLALVADAFRIGRDSLPVSVKGLRVGVCRSPVWREIQPGGELALATAARRLADAGAIVEDLDLPDAFNGLDAAHATIVRYEGGVSFLPEYINAGPMLARDLKARVENTGQITAERLLAAHALADRCRPMLDALFGPELDVILTPGSRGEAPVGLHSTGEDVFNRMWTLLHAPNIGIPACFTLSGLPVGVTLITGRLTDARLLAIAAACAPVIDQEMEVRKKTLWPG
jgi:Asp-tRNA(Asn)/Glu-tRNA(Gln) amidotransferase A subunit family amidase